MPTSIRPAFRSFALLIATLSATACAGFSSTDSADEPAATPPGGAEGGDAAGGAKAPMVTGTPDKSEINETFGVFVSPAGRADNDGTRERPLGTIQAGVELGKKLGKRVYVCTGRFAESITLADSISIIGGLDCKTATWRTGAAHTLVEAPSSPAMRAKDITSATRIEALDVVAPKATTASASSIGLIAERSGGLVIAKSKITAGGAMNGDDGTDGIQLVQSGVRQGAPTVNADKCVDGVTCDKISIFAFTLWKRPPGGKGGISMCSGAPGHDGQPGGSGGSGGLYARSSQGIIFWKVFANMDANVAGPGQILSGARGSDGARGEIAATIGSISADGYAAASGVPGTNGAPGDGGSGGRGNKPMISAALAVADEAWRGAGGPGGGAGGCPGLAGTPGTGGGASIAVALIDSPIVLDGTDLASGTGGNGGRGTFGSDPTPGGDAGANLLIEATFNASAGGNGGAPGVSTNGSSGPSLGVLHSGATPTIRGGKFTPGKAGVAIAPRTYFDALSNMREIPATPAGVAKDIFAL